MTQYSPEDTVPVNAVCPQCGNQFVLTYGEYGDGTLRVDASVSAGVYGISVVCPHCKNEETIY